MKTIKKSITLLASVLIAFSTINCNSQIKATKKKEQQPTIEYPEAKLVQKNVGTLDEELQGELQIALGDNDIVALTRVLQKGADANTLPGNTDMYPIMLAETQESAKLLLENGANPLVYDANGQNLLHYAVSKEHALDLIPLYVSLGVAINARDKDDNTPLSLAIIYFEETRAFDSQEVFLGEESNKPSNTKPNPYKILETLIKAGADMNAFDQYGYTLLMNSVTQNNSKLVQILLELGADKAIRNQYGETAKDIAYKMGRRHIYQLLE
jgi:ankyrin repeat protein